MKRDNVIELKKPVTYVDDPLTEVIRNGARRLLAEALEVEVETVIESYTELRLSDGRQRITRNGYLPERSIQTGVGEVHVKAPRVRDRAGKTEKNPIGFSSSILPSYLRKTKSLEELIPWLYLKGLSTGDFSEALSALVGKNAPGLSPATVSRLKVGWEEDMKAWNQRDLTGKRYVYWWVDGLHCHVRMDEKQCLLVIIGATENGDKELIALEDGYRESEQSWLEVLLDLKKRGLTKEPELAIGDGALGFWKALPQAYGETRWQRCWVHKTANILNKLPTSLQKHAKEKIQAIWMAPNRQEAEKNFNLFIATYEAKYPKATNCLEKDRKVLLTFYDFPAEHWRHIRTTNPIESTFATVRLRTAKVRNCFSATTVITMAFQLCRCAQKRWIKLHGFQKLAKVIEGVKFVDGMEIKQCAA